MTSQTIHITVNQQKHTLVVDAGEMLSDTLREQLRLTGTKVGCQEAECGACTVLLNGEATLTCIYPAARADGAQILTIEGLMGEELHPLQQAFVDQGAVQCGFCIPGQIMSAYALLRRDPLPTQARLRHALKDTLCRCAAYPTIERAILSAAQRMAGQPAGDPLAVPESPGEQQVIGRNVMRPDAIEKVTGTAIFTDDISFPDMLHAAVKRAGIPAGILDSVDTAQAKAIPGVIAVLTAADLPAARTHGLVVSDWPILIGIGEQINTVGDAIAIVAAETRTAALQAIEQITVQITPLAPLIDPIQAHQPEARKLQPNGNLLKHIRVRKGDLTEGFAAADLVLEHTFHTAATDHAFIEPECAIARPLTDGRMEIYVGSQIPYSDRAQVARALGWPEERVRVLGQTMGGGFGGKEDIAGQIHAALLANITGRPVKLLFDRRESLLVHPKRHATQITVRMGARNDGCLTAVETILYGDSGAYASLGEKVMTRATTHSSGPYEVPHVAADCYAMYTNNPPAGAFRGFGVTQSAFAIETMIDKLAETLQMDPIALRKQNALRVGSVTNTGQLLVESAGLLACIERVETELHKLAGDQPFASREIPGQPHLRRAWGIAAAYKNTGLGGGAPDKSGAEVQLYSDGTFEVRTSAAELGQGLVTVLQMIVAEEFNQPLESVRVLVMDTDLTPDGGPTTASRQTYVTGNAARHAAQALRSALSAMLAERFDLPPQEIRYIEGLAQVGAQQVPLGELVAWMEAEGRSSRVLYEYWAPATKPLGQGGDMHFAYSFAAQAAEVEVNTRTGEVRVIHILAATDVGRALNPLGLHVQVEGGVMMGLGNALTEEFIVEEGMVYTDRLARYRIPSIVHTPIIDSYIIEDPTQEGPYGAKGIGEIVSIPTTPAITNAIYNAVGVRIDRLPVDQELIARTLWERTTHAL